MNVANFIFQLLHIHNLPTLYVLTPFCLPCTPFVDYAHLTTKCENTYGDCIDFFVNCANTHDDQTNTIIVLADTPNISSLDIYIPNLAPLQLLLIYRSKIKNVFTIGSMIYFLFSSFFICGFCISHLSLSSCVKIRLLNSTCTLFPIY
jgi:hypothetical protein